MVIDFEKLFASDVHFQYSLCRVVLMVTAAWSTPMAGWPLSVLALSSRFDGRSAPSTRRPWLRLSVLALSSRFDGLFSFLFTSVYFIFQYSLCRVVLMVLAAWGW